LGTPPTLLNVACVMLARVRSAAVLGIDAYLVEVETDIASGLPTFVTVGLPQGAVKEGRDCVSSALANTGYTFPLKRITVNLAPADIRKEGSAFDLPIALGILAATEQVAAERLGKIAVLGELGLEGAIRPVRGALVQRERFANRPGIMPTRIWRRGTSARIVRSRTVRMHC
jgi:magnesium chelatase family protein